MADVLTPDLCVIGAGSGGLAVVEAARAHGASVVLVEKGRLGGNALATGAVPAQALIAAAARARAITGSTAFGIQVDGAKVSFRRVHDHVEQVIAALSPQSAVARLAALGVDILAGEGRFLDRNTVVVGDSTIKAHRFVIATGARAVVPSIPGLDAVPHFTTETILDNTRKLTHLVVIGATPLGLALAQAYQRLGTQVTVVGQGATLGGVDPELAAVALRQLAEEGVSLRAEASVSAIQPRSMGTGVVVGNGEQQEVLDVSHILVATERVPMLDSLDLERARIKRDKADPRRLRLTPELRTSNPRVYAVGDATGGLQSAHAAARQGEAVVRHVLLGTTGRPGALAVPRLVSTAPEIAEIGLNEAEARARHGERFRLTRVGYAESDMARATRETNGLAKLITDPAGRILGAGVVGAGAGELVALFSLAMSAGLNARQLADFVAPYPSLAELAVRLGEEFRRGEGLSPLRQRWIALRRMIG